MLVRQGNCVARVDVQATRRAYEALPCVACTCCYCRNFVPASSQAPSAIRAALYNLGIDVRKADEAIQFARPEGSPPVWYNAIYHLVGDFVDPAPASVDLDIAEAFELDTAQLYFGAHLSFLETVPPYPIVRVEIWLDLPWVLAEEMPKD